MEIGKNLDIGNIAENLVEELLDKISDLSEAVKKVKSKVNERNKEEESFKKFLTNNIEKVRMKVKTNLSKRFNSVKEYSKNFYTGIKYGIKEKDKDVLMNLLNMAVTIANIGLSTYAQENIEGPEKYAYKAVTAVNSIALGIFANNIENWGEKKRKNPNYIKQRKLKKDLHESKVLEGKHIKIKEEITKIKRKLDELKLKQIKNISSHKMRIVSKREGNYISELHKKCRILKDIKKRQNVLQKSIENIK